MWVQGIIVHICIIFVSDYEYDLPEVKSYSGQSYLKNSDEFLGSGGMQGTAEDWGAMKSEHQFRLAMCSEVKACKEVLKKTVI